MCISGTFLDRSQNKSKGHVVVWYFESSAVNSRLANYLTSASQILSFNLITSILENIFTLSIIDILCIDNEAYVSF